MKPTSLSTSSQIDPQRRAFRDVLMERVGNVFFNLNMDNLRKQDWFYEVRVPNVIDAKEDGPLIKFTLHSYDLKVRGFENANLTYFRVIRHFGVRLRLTL